jgi:hypothetical protein
MKPTGVRQLRVSMKDHNQSLKSLRITDYNNKHKHDKGVNSVLMYDKMYHRQDLFL